VQLVQLEFKENVEILDRKDTLDLLVLDKLDHKEIRVFGEILDQPAQPAQLDPPAQPDQPEQQDVRAQLDKLVILEIMDQLEGMVQLDILDQLDLLDILDQLDQQEKQDQPEQPVFKGILEYVERPV
jgi:hypothetical protein